MNGLSSIKGYFTHVQIAWAHRLPHINIALKILAIISAGSVYAAATTLQTKLVVAVVGGSIAVCLLYEVFLMYRKFSSAGIEGSSRISFSSAPLKMGKEFTITLEQAARAQSRSFRGEVAELYDKSGAQQPPLTCREPPLFNGEVLQKLKGLSNVSKKLIEELTITFFKAGGAIDVLKNKYPQFQIQSVNGLIRVKGNGLGRTIEFWQTPEGDWEAWVAVNKKRAKGHIKKVGEVLCIRGLFHQGQRAARSTIDITSGEGARGFDNELRVIRYLKNNGDPQERMLYQNSFVTYITKKEINKVAFLTPWAPPLSERLERRVPLELEEKNRIIEQLLVRLEFLEKFIIHRDIKPENIFLNETGELYVGDFDCALINGISDGIAYGTGHYRASEISQAEEEEDAIERKEKISECTTKKIDIWAFGWTLLEIELCGKGQTFPFYGMFSMPLTENQQTLFNNWINECRARSEIKPLLVRALQINPDKRASIKELKEIWTQIKIQKSFQL